MDTETTTDAPETEEDVQVLPDDIDGLFFDPVTDSNEVFSDAEIVEISDPKELQHELFPELSLGVLIDQLSAQRLIVVAGAIDDKRFVARSVAWEFAQGKMDIEGDQLDALEYRHSDARGLLQKMDATATPTVFVITDVEPHQFGGSLNRFYQATRSRHWLVLTTDRPRDAWTLSERARPCWLEPDRSTLFTPGSLGRYLEQRITQKISESDVADAHRLNSSEDYRAWAELLGTPESIDYFVFEYIGLLQNDALDPAALEALFHRAVDPPELIHGWFVNQLSDREQTVAIALALIDGMDEVAAFEVLERLMNEVWQRRDSTFRFIDYGDLQNLRNHFVFDQNRRGVARILTRGVDTRFHVLSAAWSTHRRQIVAALQSLLGLALESVAGTQTLSSFRLRSVRRQYRSTVSHALGDVARLSLGAVEPLLLALVNDGRVASYVMLGDALGQLRASGENTEGIFEMLQRWRGQGEVHRFLASRLKDAGLEKVEIMMGSAVSVVLGRLANSDERDHIHPTIVDLLKSYCSSEKSAIINVLSQYTVPQLVTLHPAQMEDLLPDLFDRVGTDPSASRSLVIGAGAGMGTAVQSGNIEISNLIKRWIKKGLLDAPARIDDSVVHMREKTMGAGLYALSLLRNDAADPDETALTYKKSSAEVLDSRDSLLNSKDAGIVLAKVLNREKHPAVREAALTSVKNLLSKEFRDIVASFESLLGSLSPVERQSVLISIVEFHQQQRSAQSGGDAVVRIKSREYPIWYDRDPPTTSIQQRVFDWAANAKEERLAAFAGDAVMSIRREHERTEEAEKENLKKQRDQELEDARKRRIDASEMHIGHRLQLSFLQRVFVIPFATRGTRSQAAVAGQLAVAKGLSAEEQAELVSRYRTANKTDIADGLERALWWDRNKWKFIIGAGVMLYLLISAAA